MEENELTLSERLKKVSDSYKDFVLGILRYADTSLEREKKIIKYLNENPDATSSQIVKFVIEQPDFHDAAKQTVLENKLYEVTDTYYGFIKGVLNYVSRRIGRVDVVLDYMNNHKDAKTSDILEFISNQDDFYEDGA